MKILFLDFDGVILTYRTLIASEHQGFSNAMPDPLLCALIRRCCLVGVQLVVSSSWRDSERQTKEKLGEGMLLRFLHEDWRTREKGCRKAEIIDWLSRHPEVTDYRIADDDDFGWTDEQRSKWFECSTYDGMPAMAMKDLAEWAGVLRTKKNRSAEPK